MSTADFNHGQRVQVKETHLHINADDTIYTIGSLDRISGDYNALLLKEGVCVGAVSIHKLKALK